MRVVVPGTGTQAQAMRRSLGNDSATSSTHPRYARRLRALRAAIDIWHPRKVRCVKEALSWT